MCPFSQTSPGFVDDRKDRWVPFRDEGVQSDGVSPVLHGGAHLGRTIGLHPALSGPTKAGLSLIGSCVKALLPLRAIAKNAIAHGGTRGHHGAPAEAMVLHLEGLAKREAQGLAEGLTKGLAEGLAKGLADELAKRFVEKLISWIVIDRRLVLRGAPVGRRLCLRSWHWLAATVVRRHRRSMLRTSL